MDLLVVGWDAATRQHLDQFDLPFWNSLPYDGDLLPEHPFNKAGYISSANAWTTISTGASFFDHGMLGFVYGKYSGHPLAGLVQWLATQQALPPLARRILIGRILGGLGSGEKATKGEKIDNTDIEYKRIWEYLDGEALIYGLPLTYPTWETNGVLVSGIPGPTPAEATHPVVYPETLEDLVYGDSTAGYYIDMNSPVNDPGINERLYCEAHQDRMEANAETYIKLYEHMEADRAPEFGFLMLRGLDDIMHATKDETLLRESYELIDRLTADLIETIDPDATVVLSDHGMRPASKYRFDKDMRMDHDTTQGVWGATEPLDLKRHTDVTHTLLDHLGIEVDVPATRDEIALATTDSDREAVHEHLEDLGYT